MIIEYKFDVEKFDYKVEKYADTHIKYHIHSTMHESVVKKFCQLFLHPAIDKQYQTNWAQDYIVKFEKIADDIWEYVVCEPNTN